MIKVGVIIIIVLLVVILINQNRVEKQRRYQIELDGDEEDLNRLSRGAEDDPRKEPRPGWALALLGLIAAGAVMFVFLQ
jgi:hypothetical protein